MSGKPGAPGCELLAAVPGLKQLTNSRLPLLSLAPSLSTVSSSSCFHFFFFPFYPLISPPLLLSLFSSTRGSPWQCAGAGDRKWVSGSAQATGSGSGWLRSRCNLSPITPTEPLSTLQLTIDSLHGINIIHLILTSFCFLLSSAFLTRLT